MWKRIYWLGLILNLFSVLAYAVPWMENKATGEAFLRRQLEEAWDKYFAADYTKARTLAYQVRQQATDDELKTEAYILGAHLGFTIKAMEASYRKVIEEFSYTEASQYCFELLSYLLLLENKPCEAGATLAQKLTTIQEGQQLPLPSDLLKLCAVSIACGELKQSRKLIRQIHPSNREEEQKLMLLRAELALAEKRTEEAERILTFLQKEDLSPGLEPAVFNCRLRSAELRRDVAQAGKIALELLEKFPNSPEAADLNTRLNKVADKKP